MKTKTSTATGNTRMNIENKNDLSPKVFASNANILKYLIIIVLYGLSSSTVDAQTQIIGTVKDYYYPEGTTKTKVVEDDDNLFELYVKFSGFNLSGVGKLTGLNYFKGEKIVHIENTVSVESNEIVLTEHNIIWNALGEKKYTKERKAILKLPKPGMTVSWSPMAEVTIKATLVNLQIEINGEKTTVLAIKDVEIHKNCQIVRYWGKNKGFVFEMSNESNEVFSYNAGIGLTSLSFKEMPFDAQKIINN